jgi:hypothetical protein
VLFFNKKFSYPVFMDHEGAKRLELRAPLLFTPDPLLLPFRYGGEVQELLFCFALDETQGCSIEPDPARFLGPLISAGHAAESGQEHTLELPRGRYIFAQEREALGKDGVISMAIEVQKDGLWERLRLEGRLYLRYLREDGKPVTQVFRPYQVTG